MRGSRLFYRVPTTHVSIITFTTNPRISLEQSCSKIALNEPVGLYRMWILRIKFEMLSSCILTSPGNRYPGTLWPVFRSVWWCNTRRDTPWTRPWRTSGSVTSRWPWTSPGWRRRWSSSASDHLHHFNIQISSGWPSMVDTGVGSGRFCHRKNLFLKQNILVIWNVYTYLSWWICLLSF